MLTGFGSDSDNKQLEESGSSACIVTTDGACDDDIVPLNGERERAINLHLLLQ